MPQSQSQAPAIHDIVITVRGDGTVRLNQEAVDLPALQQRLTLRVTKGSGHVVFVRGERNLEFRQVAEVIDIAKGAGVDRVGLMTQ